MPLLDSLTLQKSIDFYTASLQAENKSPKTMKAYSHNLSLFIKFVGDGKMSTVNSIRIREFLIARGQAAAPATLHQAFRVLRAFFNWCYREEFIDKSPMGNIKAPKIPRKIIPVFTHEEVQRMLAVCPPKKFKGARDRAIIALLLDSGMRESELIGLKTDDIDYHQGAIKLFGKGAKERIVYINEKARLILARYMFLREYKSKRQERVFLSEEMRPLTADGLRTIFRKIRLAAGIQKGYIHMFRHTFAIEFLRAGGDIVSLQKILGHEDLKTTLIYLTAWNEIDKIKAHRIASPGDRFL